MSTGITYTTLSMNQMTELAETIGTKQVTDYQQTTESFEVVKIKNDNNQFNITVTNTGNIPVHITRLWVENTTDSAWPISKFDLDVTLASGNSTTNIGQNIGLTALDTESYVMKLVTERGNTQKLFLNSVGEDSLYLNLRAIPTIVPTTFTTTLVLEVINNGTNKLLNLQPVMIETDTTCIVDCDAKWVSGPTPASFDSLDPGNMVTFEWVYAMEGADGGDSALFTAGLINGIGNDTSTVVVQPVVDAENANVALESGGVAADAVIDDDILLFHMEQSLVPTPGYQMMSSESDGGNSGLKLDMETYESDTPLSFFTNNGTKTITIPAGDWVASLTLRSEPVATSLPSGSDVDEDMIFHFEDGQGNNPVNSESDSDRDLEECGISQFQEDIQRTNDDAEQRGTTVDRGDGGNPNSSDHELVYDGGFQYVGLRWSLDVEQGADIDSAYIEFHADESSSIASPTILIGAEKTLNAGEFIESSNNISNRWDGTTNTVTTATVGWNNIAQWSTGSPTTGTTTPDLKTIVKEIVDDQNWVSGNNIVFMFKTASGDNTFKRTADHYDSSFPAELTVNHGTTGAPTWFSTDGPHGSGVYKYDGSTMCHRSSNNVSGGDGNNLGNEDNTTALWFRTDGAVTTEQMLVFWEGDGTYPNHDYYKISIGDGIDAKILFEYNLNQGGSHTSTCQSVGTEYDDGEWYHVVGVRTQVTDSCDLYITDINGVNLETIPFTPNPVYSSSSVDADGKWFVATMDERTSFYFKGWIDDILHWDEAALTSIQAADLATTNYGTGAHQLDFNVYLTDTDGNNPVLVHNTPAAPIGFQDPKDDDGNDDEYSQFNVTLALPEVVITSAERLNFTMNFVPSISTWEALELDIKLDDSDFTLPTGPSYIQIPYPDNPFPSYIEYEKTTQFEVFVDNTGTDGVYLIYQGTRVSFDGDGGAFSSFIDTVNGTSASYVVDENRDSIYIPANQTAQLYFYENPSDHPCQNSSCSASNVISAGSYKVGIWVNGYTDQGEAFGRSVLLGLVTVID